MKEIIFTKTVEVIPDKTQPQPASQLLPEWYKNLDGMYSEHIQDKTIKKCMPFFDVLAAGYIISTIADVNVTQRNGLAYYEWPSPYFEALAFHDPRQAPTHPAANGMPYPKWINPWGIQTPKGYSVLIINPPHRESPFSILEAIVDTDKMITPINFPFVLKDAKFEGLIPEGTPMAQIIPFKRENWKIKIGNEKNIKAQLDVNFTMQTRFSNAYKDFFRTLKVYK
jgi:hypothetical protein